MKNKVLILIILFLIATNATTFFLVIREDDEQRIEVPNDHLGRFFRDELNLNRQQHNQFRTFRQIFHSQSNQIISNMQYVREEMLDELAKHQPDTVKLYQFSESIGDLHRELKHQTIEYYLNMKKICNNKQKEKLHEIFKSMISPDGNLRLPTKQNISIE